MWCQNYHRFRPHPERFSLRPVCGNLELYSGNFGCSGAGGLPRPDTGGQARYNQARCVFLIITPANLMIPCLAIHWVPYPLDHRESVISSEIPNLPIFHCHDELGRSGFPNVHIFYFPFLCICSYAISMMHWNTLFWFNSSYERIHEFDLFCTMDISHSILVHIHRFQLFQFMIVHCQLVSSVIFHIDPNWYLYPVWLKPRYRS